MNDSMLMQAKSHRAELTREAGQGRTARRADAADAQEPRQDAIARIAAGRLADHRDRLAAAGDRGKMAGTMNRSATANDTVITEKAGSER